MYNICVQLILKETTLFNEYVYNIRTVYIYYVYIIIIIIVCIIMLYM